MHPATDHYQTGSVTTAGPAQLVLMLFDRAIVAVERARRAAAEPERIGALQTINDELQRAQDIVTELQVALDFERGGQIAANLWLLYDFCLSGLVDANVSKDVDGLAPVTRTLTELRDAWEAACCTTAVGAA